MKNVIIHGLRRSGTTILWETLRTSSTLTCYDEPFHPKLAEGHRQNHKGTWVELKEFLAHKSHEPQPIPPLEELSEKSEKAQIEWLGNLCNSVNPTVIDTVRCWNRAPSVQGNCENTVTVQLVRDPISWVSAHVLPSGQPKLKRRATNVYRRWTFFSRRGMYDDYHYETIINAALDQKHSIFSYVALPSEELQKQPAYIKLLAFWWGANATLFNGLRLSNTPVMTISLGEFRQDPKSEVSRISRSADWNNLTFRTDGVQPTNKFYGMRSERWIEAFNTLGIPLTLSRLEKITRKDLEQSFARANAF